MLHRTNTFTKKGVGSIRLSNIHIKQKNHTHHDQTNLESNSSNNTHKSIGIYVGRELFQL